MRNMYVSYRGGTSSRAGTSYVNYSGQTNRGYPPRFIPFQFSITQGLVLEFGHQYMRVVYQGGMVTDVQFALTGVTKGNPTTIQGAPSGATTVAPNVAGLTSGYVTGEQITLAGGTYTVPAVVRVDTATLKSTTVFATGGGFVPGDTINLAGGTATTAAVINVTTTQVVDVAINAAGTGGTNGTRTLTGTTGTGAKFQVSVTISGGSITGIRNIVLGGTYTVNPTSLSAEPVTGAGLTGATVSIQMGVKGISVGTGGTYTQTPPGGAFTQAGTSGTGSGATFGSSVLAPQGMSFVNQGSYTSFPPNPVAQASTTGSGAGVTYNVSTGPASPINNGDWVSINGANGMPELNGRTYIATNATATGFDLLDVYGQPIDSSSFGDYTGGGFASRIYTLTTPYSEEDLSYLKYSQSSNQMTFTCVNQETNTEYPPLDFVRVQDNQWTIQSSTPSSSNISPSLINVSISGFTDTGILNPVTVYYTYTVTAVDKQTGQESAPVATGTTSSTIDMAAVQATVTISWNDTGAGTYNVYKAFESYSSAQPVGVTMGFIGQIAGTTFTDSNLTPDVSQTPPIHNQPFTPGAPQNVSLSPASTYTNPSSGVYPGVSGYFQQRRIFGYTLNNPDQYRMSVTGHFQNFDSRLPSTDTDAIVGTPWSTQVNGVQFFVSMPGGLVVLTGIGAWQLTGAGGSSLSPQSLTPASQQAQPQAFNGCSAKIPPLKIDYDIIYVQAKGSIYRDLEYQFFTNIYTGSDLTSNSPHLFSGYTITAHAYSEEPYKIIWATRNDGVLLSLTYLKKEQVTGWARHDTLGEFVGVCSITEPPVDALYLATLRYIGGKSTYFIERMDDRVWNSVEDSWCVDCGKRLGQYAPNADILVSSAHGLGAISGVTGLVGGQNYSPATYGSVIDDDEDGGDGAIVSLTIVNGAIGAVNASGGSGYLHPRLVIIDPIGSGDGASASLVLDNSATATTSADVFSAGNIGAVIRSGGGIMTITGFTNARQVTVNILDPIAQVVPNGSGLPSKKRSGSWTMVTPVTTISGLSHLAGMTVTGLADGNVITPRQVSANGTLTLDTPASSVTIGLGFQVQFQSPYLDSGDPTVQGSRKLIPAATIRVEGSRDFKVGSNQVDGSTLKPPQIAPVWTNLDDTPNLGMKAHNSLTTPLYTGDVRVPIKSGYDKHGQIAVQQDAPLPLDILALIPEILAGDISEQVAKKKGQQQ